MIRSLAGRGWLIALLLYPAALVAAAPGEPTQDPPGGQESEEEVESRTRLLRLKRLSKLRYPVPPPPKPKIERALIWIENEGRDRLGNLHFKRFFPQFGGTPTGSGYAFGFRYWNPRINNSAVDVLGVGLSSLRGYQIAQLQVGHIDQPQRKLSLFADLRFRDWPQEDFFGIGPDSLRSERTDYRITDYQYAGVLRYQPKRWLRADVRTSFIQIEAGPGTDDRFADINDLFTDEEAPGLARQPDFFNLTGKLLFDYRDVPGNPHRGGAVELTVERYEALDDSEFDFTRLGAEVQHYIPLGIPSRVLALRLTTSFDVSDEGNRVPFYFLKTLGGSGTLRGFREFRFRDRNLLSFSAEYRWEAAQAVEVALFGDAGKVFASSADFGFTDLEAAYGIGLRVKSRSAVLFRIDVAKSREGFRIYFKFEPSF